MITLLLSPPVLPEVVITVREREILQEIANGLGSKQIEQKFFIAKDTVESHRKNIIKKMRAESMCHAVAMAFRLGFIL